MTIMVLVEAERIDTIFYTTRINSSEFHYKISRGLEVLFYKGHLTYTATVGLSPSPIRQVSILMTPCT